MAEPNCHYCTRPAEAECATCGRLYCAEHGEDVCLRCLSPESATPSARVYRGSLLALAVASVVTIFLLVRPPSSKSEQDTARVVATATPAVSATATPTPQNAARTPTAPPGTAAGSTPAGTAGSAPAGTPPPGTVAATPTAAQQTYTVQPGDTISGIAARFGVDPDALLAANPSISAQALPIGAVLKIPAGR
jgi:LysM repeat protein